MTPFESSEDLLGQKKSYDLYLIEILMPEMTGEEVVLELRRRGFHCVIIIVSTIQSRKTITHILRSGANDYIPKPFDGELGQARLRSHLRTLGMLQKQARRSTKLKRLASIDELTGVYNRRHTLLLLKGEMEKATRYNRDLTLLLLDIDHFKKVNDGYGHLTGDLVLRQFAKAAKAQCRDVDVFGRYGGEEFLLLMPETNEKNASILAERIRAAIASLVLPCMTEGITVSGGLVEFQGRNSNELISEADRRLYYAKEHGRNQIVGSNGPIQPQENGESA